MGTHGTKTGFTILRLRFVGRRGGVVNSGQLPQSVNCFVAWLAEDKWLTYWSCFSLVTLVMTLVERTAGAPLGLYTACLGTTLYLMLPMFNGADVVFRSVLVPIAGQREALLLKDAKTLAKTMIKQLPASRHGEAGEAIAEAFLVEAKMQK